MSSSLSTFFSWLSNSASSAEFPEIFPLNITESDFVKCDVETIFSKIMIDAFERTHGLSDDEAALLWDNCVKSESSDGLISMLCKAIVAKGELYLVYDPAIPIIRKATYAESEQIKADYAKSNESSVGSYISFKSFNRVDMIKLYSALEYTTISALTKSMNLSKAIQVKMNDLRSTVSLTDSTSVNLQAKAIAEALSNGKDVLLDAKDSIENTMPDLTSVQSAMSFIAEKQAFYLGMPESYITGKAPKGLGDSGEGDTKAVERGLKIYYFSIIKPVLFAVFGKKTTYKSEDYTQLSTNLEMLKTFDITSDEYMSAENKLKLVNKVFGFPEDEKGGQPDPVQGPKALSGRPMNDQV